MTFKHGVLQVNRFYYAAAQQRRNLFPKGHKNYILWDDAMKRSKAREEHILNHW